MTEEQSLLLEVLYQECFVKETKRRDYFDNRCLSIYEDICLYLTEKGILQSKNGRVYWKNK